MKTHPSVTCREEFDGTGCLFHADTGKIFGVNAIGLFIWKGLAKGKSKEQILAELTEVCKGGIPATADADFDNFVKQLQEKNFLSLE